MNEEELTEKLNTEKDIVEAFNNGFQKGKLEQKKEELGFIKKIYRKYCFEILLKERIKQLQKEIGGNEK